MSMAFISHTSWTILLITTVDPTTWGRACSWGAFMVMQGESSLHKDLAISANLGGSISLCVVGLPGSVFTHWVKIFSAPVLSLETCTIEGMVSFEGPMPLVGSMPLVLVMQFLPLQHSQGGEGSMVSTDLEGVTHTQFKGSTGSNTWALVKAINGSIHSLNSLTHSNSWHGSSSRVVWLDWPNVVGLWCMPKCFGVVSNDSPVSQTSDPSSGGRHHGPDNERQEALCNH